jgi:LysR family transcriptional regulator, glycine cleavage system transcriptional activator
MSRLPPLNALRCFEAAARHRSFSKAAAELNVTQSAVSHQVRQLEDWFGVILFERQGRQTIATPRGEHLALALADALAIMHDACRQVKSTLSNGTLTIGVLPSIATIWLIPKLDAFFKAYPDIPVKLVYSLQGQALNFNDIDIAITWGPRDEQPALVTRIFPGDTVAVANPSLVARDGPFTTPKGLLTAPLLHDTDRIGWQRFMKKLGLRHPHAEHGPVFEDFNMLRAAALAGQGVALCPRSLINDDVVAGRLVLLYNSITINENYGYWLVEPENQEGRATAVAAFKAWLIATAGA